MTEGGPGPGMAGAPVPSGTFRIDRDGVWHHEGVEVTHPGVLRNLYANLRADGERYHLQVGPYRVPVDVVDAPFVVVRAEADFGAGTVEGHLSDGSRERLEPDTIHLDRRGTPYCRVKDGRFRARLSVAAWLQLAAAVEADPRSGEAVLCLGGRRISLRRRDDEDGGLA
jgi:uncharacterized protein